MRASVSGLAQEMRKQYLCHPWYAMVIPSMRDSPGILHLSPLNGQTNSGVLWELTMPYRKINRVTMGHNPIRRDCQVPALADVISPPKRWWELVIASVPSPLPTLASNTLNSPILHDPVGGVPTMGVPPNHPKLDHLSIETYGFGVPP